MSARSASPPPMAGRSVVDKAVAVVFPISAFVAAGFEHSIANMYLMGGSVPVGLAYHLIYRGGEPPRQG